MCKIGEQILSQPGVQTILEQGSEVLEGISQAGGKLNEVVGQIQQGGPAKPRPIGRVQRSKMAPARPL